eukprot:9637491-Alexandrium_andersonii.AAC.1
MHARFCSGRADLIGHRRQAHARTHARAQAFSLEPAHRDCTAVRMSKESCLRLEPSQYMKRRRKGVRSCDVVPLGARAPMSNSTARAVGVAPPRCT